MWLARPWLLACLRLIPHLASVEALTHTVAVLSDGLVCQTPAVTTVSVIPVYVSTYIPGPTQIDIFGNGNTIIFNGPTTIITSSTITVTVSSTLTVTVDPSITALPSGGGGGLTSAISSSGSLPIGSGSNSVSGPGPASSGSNSAGTSGVGTPPVTSATATPASTFSTSLSYSEPTLTLGQGLPTGIITSLPPGQGSILLGFAGRVGNAIQSRAAVGVSVTATGYLQGSGEVIGGCGNAARWSIDNGMLVSGGASVGKSSNALSALISPSQTRMDVNVTFYLDNGILGWNTTDVGPASCFRCGDRAYAAFPIAPFDNCTAITIGAVDADLCPVGGATMVPASSSASTQQSSADASTSTSPSPGLSSSTLSNAGSSTNTGLSSFTSSLTSSAVVSSSSSQGMSGSTFASGASASSQLSSVVGTSASPSVSISTTSPSLPQSTSTAASSSAGASTAMTIPGSLTSSSSAASSSQLNTVSATPSSQTASSASSVSAGSASQTPTSPSSSLSQVPSSMGDSNSLTGTSLPTTNFVSSTTRTVSGTSYPSPTVSLCSGDPPAYNYQAITLGQNYEVECNRNIAGQDIGLPPGFREGPVNSLEDCIAACNLWNQQQGTTYCIAVTFVGISGCYPKSIINGITDEPGTKAARVLSSGYPSITDFNPSSTTVMSTGVGLPSTIIPTLPSSILSSILPTLPSSILGSNLPTLPSSVLSSILPTLPSSVLSSNLPTLPSSVLSSNLPTLPSSILSVNLPTSSSALLSSIIATPSPIVSISVSIGPSLISSILAPSVSSIATIASSPGILSPIPTVISLSSVLAGSPSSSSLPGASSSSIPVGTLTAITVPASSSGLSLPSSGILGATTTSASSPSSGNPVAGVIPTQALCAGFNLDPVPSSTPTLGAYNYEAIISGNHVFEVQCYGNINGDSLDAVFDVPNVEGCAVSCGAYNDANPGTTTPCVGAVFFNGVCYRKSSYGIPSFDQGVRSVRLINAGFGYPAINDQMYPIPNIASSTLCAGPSSTAFAFQTVVPQRNFDNRFQYAPASGTAFKYEVNCQRRITGTVGLTTFLTSFLTGGNSLNSYEDCLRYCEFANENAANSCSGFNYDPRSLSTCDIFSAVTGAIPLPGVSGGRLFGSGNGYDNSTARP